MAKDFSYLLARVIELCKNVGTWIAQTRPEFSKENIEIKEKNSLVSYVDRNAEEKLIDALHKILPEAGFLAEEGTFVKQNPELQWIIDPLDGTTNFIHDLPMYAISVGLECEGKIVLGVVYDIPHDEMYYAAQGKGAFCNQTQIHVSNTQLIEDALIATGFPYTAFGYMKQYLNVFEPFMRQSRGIRRLGSAALDLCYLAKGRFDGFFEYNLNPWDVAGGVIIIQEAGGILSTFNNQDNYVHGHSIVGACTSELHQKMLQILSLW
ncbi:MAG: inositol monophosphatase [Bacteroidia bacterium]|nr:inositol monophosphatase [Bacteroidia bacterium]MDW8346630.1 inositol monophosphatase family protein [Bacteroidia bacterium]